MLRKFLRLFHTLRYIKGIQLRYQLWYRFKNKFISIHWYKNYLQRSFEVIDVEVSSTLHSNQKEYFGSNEFELIGLQQTFGDFIDWNYQGHGKLWNYNLQYFTYLLDETIPSEERLRLLKDFSHQLLSSNIQPEPYPVSLRIINTLLFHSRYPITDSIVLEALQKQIDYLDHNLEYHLLANHLLENAFSLFIASIYLADTSLYNRSYRLLIGQLDEQILSDGGHYECSVMYQSILLSKLLLCIDIARKGKLFNRISLTFLEEKATKMLGWMNTYSFPDGSWALMNDAAEKIAPTTRSLNDAATILNIIPANIQLGDSGFRKLKGSNWELLIKTGGVQPSYQPGHVHADISSYCLWYKGRQAVVDPGISTYAISEQRNVERGTFAHNTISFNRFNQSDVWGGFRVGKRAVVKNTEEASDRIAISIQPFFNSHYRHERKFIKMDEYRFSIEDKILHPSSSSVIANGNIQFAKDVFINHQDDTLMFDGVVISLTGVNQAAICPGQYALSYHQLQTGLRFQYKASLFSRLSFEFA